MSIVIGRAARMTSIMIDPRPADAAHCPACYPSTARQVSIALLVPSVVGRIVEDH